MIDYRKLYLLLFNSVTDAIKALDEGQADEARVIMIKAQQNAEELYISNEDI